MIGALLLAATATVTSTPLVQWGPPGVRPPSFAIVIGNNHPLPGSDYERLRYADDDAMRVASFLEGLGTQVYLLAGVDQETAARFGDRANRARVPTREALEAALEDVTRAMEVVEDRNPELYFYFSGHGTVTAAEAYLHLVDEPFSRTDLAELVLRKVPAYRKHVIIDSCHSYFLVSSRGQRVPAALTEDTLERHPNTGFLLSTSAEEEVQEWSGYQAGVFSYQVLGALQGAADVDGDGIVTYAEVQGYLVAANHEVDNAKVRIQPFVRRPHTRGKSLVDLRVVEPERRLHVDAELAGHFYISDAAGRRVLDANKPAGMALALVTERERELYLFAERSVHRIEPRPDGLVLGAPLADATDRLASRGPIADELRRSLFKRTLTPEFVAGVEAMALQTTSTTLDAPYVAAVSWHDDNVTVAFLGSGLAIMGGGAVLSMLAADATADANVRPITQEGIDASQRVGPLRAGAVTAFSVGATALIIGIVRAIVSNELLAEEPAP
ncbi:MAG: caspase family protein [Deltaproteobacteria bacterium]